MRHNMDWLTADTASAASDRRAWRRAVRRPRLVVGHGGDRLLETRPTNRSLSVSDRVMEVPAGCSDDSGRRAGTVFSIPKVRDGVPVRFSLIADCWQYAGTHAERLA